MKWRIVLFGLIISFFSGCVSKNLDVDTSKIKKYKKFEYNQTLYIPYDKKSKKFVPTLTNKKVVGFRLDNLQLIKFKKIYSGCSRGFGKDNCAHCTKFGPFYEPDLSRTAPANFMANLFMGAISLGIMPLLSGFPTDYDCKLNNKNIEYVIGNFLNKYHLNDDKRNKILYYYNKQYELANENKKYILRITKLLGDNKNLLYINNNFVQKDFSCQINKCYNILLSNYNHTLESLKANKNLYNYLKKNGIKINTLAYAKNLTNNGNLIKIINSKIFQLQLLELKKQGENKFKKYNIVFNTINLHNLDYSKYAWAFLVPIKDGFLIKGWKVSLYNGEAHGLFMIIKLNKKGKVLWKKNFFEPGEVIESNNKLYFVNESGSKIYVLNSKNGNLINSIKVFKNHCCIRKEYKKFDTFGLKYFYTFSEDGYLIKIDNSFLKLEKMIDTDMYEIYSFFYLKDDKFILETDDKKFYYINIYDLKGKKLKTFRFNKSNDFINLGVPVFCNRHLLNNPLFVFESGRYILTVGSNVIGDINTPSARSLPVVYVVSKNEAFILGTDEITYVVFNNKQIIYYKSIYLPYSIEPYTSYIDVKRNIIYALDKKLNKVLCIHLK